MKAIKIILLLIVAFGIAQPVSAQMTKEEVKSFVEKADVHTLFSDSLHPETKGLMASIPGIKTTDKEIKLEAINTR